MHYWGKDIDDHDDDRDQQLPFKTMDAHSVPHSFVPLSKAIVLHYHDAPFISVNYPVTKDNYLPDPATNSLFRPPRA
ncbi:hypothetical protein GA0116948_101205 [Chitinophaga costaii]|uniref:Uncharacterized protein n=2 Tax=Chitinophaga costaii TaxID=1335309 RepID=A0A1C3Z287_9BACT|nr:hypothetical protein GA0116948_101205 [Chitinophaga costaii]